MRHRFPAAFVTIVAIIVFAWTRAGASDTPLPAVLAQVTSFRGHLTYRARPADDPSAITTGSLTAGNGGWTLDETSACCQVHASDRDSWIRNGSQTIGFDEPLEVDALANSWAVVLATSLDAQMHRDAGGSSWVTSAGRRFYVDRGLTEVIGVADTDSGVAFSYGDWTVVNGLQVPQSIERLRGALAGRAFLIDDYQAQWAPNNIAVATTSSAVIPAEAGPHTGRAAAPVVPWGLHLLRTAFILILTAFGAVAWTRRDVFIDRLGRRLASDPRAWRHAGVSAFVSPDGMLTFEGRSYRIGSVFYNRPVVIQTSPLFIKVSAPGESRTLILARKFPVPAMLGRRAAAGFTLVESLTACALFALVIVAAVFPTLVVLAHADRLAAQRQTALQIASNALTDEEAALAYGTSIADESAVSTVGGLTLTESVTPSGVAGLHDLAVEVTDSSGMSLARIVTRVGPPVPPPSPEASAPPTDGGG